MSDPGSIPEDEPNPMPREVRNVIEPVKLSVQEQVKFKCHPGVSCFNACCRDIEILLTPYDILRIRKRLDISAEAFLLAFAEPKALEKDQLPVVIIRMDEKSGSCPFNLPEGCSIYDDRPAACRYYPLGSGFMRRQEQPDEEEFYFLVKEGYCKGHDEEQVMTVGAYREDQGVDEYDRMNREWLEFILKRRSLGEMVSTIPKVAQFFYMISANADEFRRFIFESTFLERYQVDAATRAAIKADDLALTRFGFQWLKSAMFGEKTVNPTDEAIAAAQKKKKSLQRLEE